MPNNEIIEEKMTLEEYENSYNSKPYNTKTVKTFLFIFAASIGIIIFTCLLLVVLRLFEVPEIGQYLGIGGAVVSGFVFCFLYVVPLIKITQTKAFITTVNSSNARQAKKWNKALREEIADKMIDFHSKTNNVGWYSDEHVGKLAIARQTKNDQMLKQTLTETYDTDVRKAANALIRDHAIKVGILTGLSQSGQFDTMLICMYELNLIKDLVLLYGYRPNDAQLMKIYKNVIADALIAYGASAATTGVATGLINKFAPEAFKGLPFMNVLGTIVESTTQGVINATLTVSIGMQTKKYLKKEYRLQDILDNVELQDDTSEEAQAEILSEVKEAVTDKSKATKPQTA